MNANNQPIIILANPQLGENIGMCMRAMLNFNLTQLRIINPRPNWSKQKAIDAAAGAAQTILPKMKIYTSTQKAVQDINYLIATTTRTRNLNIKTITPTQTAKNIKTKIMQKQNTAIIFGSEANGLSNDDIAQAHAITNINSNPNFQSLNLAQAVMIMAYEYNQIINKEIKIKEIQTDIAPLKDIDFFCNQLDEKLHTRKFYTSINMRPHVKRNLRIMFQRMQPSNQDIKTWHGIIKNLTRKSS